MDTSLKGHKKLKWLNFLLPSCSAYDSLLWHLKVDLEVVCTHSLSLNISD